jgi:hypothetical protein
MNAPQSAESISRHTSTAEIRHLDLLGGADHDVFDLSFSIEEHTDLAAGLIRDLGHLACKFRGNDLVGRNAACRKAFDAAKLIVFEPLGEAGNSANNRPPLNNYYTRSAGGIDSEQCSK